MITLLATLCSLIVVTVVGIFSAQVLGMNGLINGFMSLLLSAFSAIQFYKFLCTIL
jgi:hypothetical protein